MRKSLIGLALTFCTVLLGDMQSARAQDSAFRTCALVNAFSRADELINEISFEVRCRRRDQTLLIDLITTDLLAVDSTGDLDFATSPRHELNIDRCRIVKNRSNEGQPMTVVLLCDTVASTCPANAICRGDGDEDSIENLGRAKLNTITLRGENINGIILNSRFTID